LINSNVDQELADLGAVPSDVQTIVARILGEAPLTLAAADALIASLGDAGVAFAIPSPASSANIEREAPAAAADPVVGTAPGLGSAPALAGAALFDSLAAPSSDPPPLFGAYSAPPIDPSIALDATKDGEATAQAIVAAFDEPESEPEAPSEPDLRLPVALAESPLPAPDELPAARALEIAQPRFTRRGERGSRRPDLDDLLDQPLDALDFERTEPLTDTTEAEARSSEFPTGAPPADSGDDFEILVDDEILEIAEDDVELVDDEPN
jgi:hypothetical protein